MRKQRKQCENILSDFQNKFSQISGRRPPHPSAAGRSLIGRRPNTPIPETNPHTMNISVAGTGYVGMSIATLLAQHNQVTAVDVVPERVDMVNNKKSPIQDDYIEEYLATKPLDLKATLDQEAGYRDAEFVVIAAPTNYDPQKNFFDTSAVESVIDAVLKVNPDAVMVIKSTIPVGYTRSLYVKYWKKGVKSSTSCSRPSSCGRARPSMTISTPAVSSSASPRSWGTGSGRRTRPSKP